MNSSLAYTANQRVERYRKSVEFVAEDVLLYKGFLGRSLKEREGLSSVGTRAARAAGVIVDSLGKLRCPPGTPNANQFTDLQMSNCMVPGLGAARRAAQKLANSTQSLIDNAQKMLRGPDGKKLKGKAKVAALASLVALDVMDYLNMDGSGSLSASTLALAEVLRYGSSQVAEAVLDRLVRQGKITETQRKNMQAILDKVATTQRFGGLAEYIVSRTDLAVRKRRMKPTRRENMVPNVVELVDDTVDAATQAKWDAYVDGLNIPNAPERERVEVNTVEEGVVALLEGKIVDMPDVEGAHMLMDELGHIIADLEEMHKNGEIDDVTLENAVFDLCQITVKGTSAFCLGNKGIPRYLMPQAEGKPVAGSRAQKAFDAQVKVLQDAVDKAIADGRPQAEIDELQKKLDKFVKKGEINGQKDMLAYLAERGIKPRVGEDGKEVGVEMVPSTKLKATQRDMQGHKVVGMMRAKKRGEYDPGKEAVFVSKDGYIIDGHHRVGAQAGMDYQDGVLGNDHQMPVIVLDANISEILPVANDWTQDYGIQRKTVAQTSEGGPTAVDILDLVKQKRAQKAQEALGQVDSRIPDVDLTTQDIGLPKTDADEVIKSVTPKLKSPRHLDVATTVSSDALLPSAPEQSVRPPGYAQITVDAEKFNAELKEKTNALLDKHGIDKNKPPSQQIDELAGKMGVVLQTPIEKQLDTAVTWMEEQGMAKANILLEADPNHSAEINAYRKIKGQAIIDAINSMRNDKGQPGWMKKNAEGRETVKQAIAQGYLEALVGMDEIFKGAPNLKGGVMLELHGVDGPASMNDAAGYAQVGMRGDGKVMAKVSLVPDSMIFDQTKQNVLPKGQGMTQTLRFMGADDHQVGLAIHEGAHAEHFMHQFKTLGIEMGENAPSISEQVRNRGDKLSDSYMGVMFSKRYDFPKDATWDEVEEEIKSKRKRPSFRNFVDGPEHNLNQYLFDVATAEMLKSRGAGGAPDLSSSDLEKLAWGTAPKSKYATELIEAVENYERDLMFPNVNPFVPPGKQFNTMSREEAAAVRQQAIDAVQLKLPEGYELFDEDGKPVTKQQLVDAVKQAMGGKKIAQVSQEYKPILDAYLGIDSQKITTNGVDNQEVMSVLGVASQYGQTNVMEAVAESRVLDVFTRQFGSFRALDDSPKKAREMLDRLFSESSVPPMGAPPSAAEYQENIQKIIAAIPRLRRVKAGAQ